MFNTLFTVLQRNRINVNNNDNYILPNFMKEKYNTLCNLYQLPSFAINNTSYYNNLTQFSNFMPLSLNRYASDSPELVQKSNKDAKKNKRHDTRKLKRLTANIKTTKTKKRFFRKVYFPNASLNMILQYRDAKHIIKHTSAVTKKLVYDKKKSMEGESPLSKVLSDVQITQPHAMKQQLRFKVPIKMNKIEIRHYLKNIYGLDINFVNTANYLGHFKRATVRTRPLYKKKDHKKAFVSLNNWIAELSPLANKMAPLFSKNRFKQEEGTEKK